MDTAMGTAQTKAAAVGGTHVAAGGILLERDRLEELAWKGRRGPIKVEREGDGEAPGAEHDLVRLPVRRSAIAAVRHHVRISPHDLAGRKQTPSPVVSWRAFTSFGNEAAADTQLGVSSTHVVVTSRTHVGFFTKAGQLQQPVIYVGDFFAPLNLKALFGHEPWYFDARSLFDSYRRRFWIGALALKNWGDDKGVVPDDTLTKFVAAVSTTEDPQDPWWLYWWDAVAHDGDTTSSVFKPGDWGDYPTLGIDQRCIYQTNHVQGTGQWNRYCHVVLFPADEMAAGKSGPIAGWQFWGLENPDGTPAWRIAPTVHHGRNTCAFFVGPSVDGDKVVVWGLKEPLTSGQQMQRAVLDLAKLAGPRDAPQAGSRRLIRTTNIQTDPLRASCRDDLLSFSMNDGADWGTGTVVSANRLVRVDVGGFPLLPQPGQAGHRERVFGCRNAIEDADTDVFAYAWPVVDTNADGDMVLVYNRTGGRLDPEIRFSTWMSGEPDIRPSRRLKGGEGPYFLSWVGANDSLPWADTGGISVDPYDDTAVWVAHAYADKHTVDGNYAIWVGKVFGERYPWLRARIWVTERRDRIVRLALLVENAGDGDAPATHAVLRGGGPAVTIGVPPLRSGSSITLAIALEPPAKSRELEVVIDEPRRIRQYSRSANVVRLALGESPAST